MLDVIAFDADDTLWHNEILYVEAQERFRALMAPYGEAAHIDETLYRTEMRNMARYGYGAKAFGLSLIETAIDLSAGRVTAADIRKLLDWTQAMLSADVRLLDHAAEAVAQLAASYPLMLITKGDPLDQERKLAGSGLAAHFRYVEVVSDKTQERYAALLARYRLDPRRFLMVGNSLRSDVLPVVALQGQAVYVPYHTTWAHERVDVTAEERQRFHELEHLGQLPELVRRIEE